MDKKQQSPGNVNLNLDTTPVLYTDNVIWNIAPDGVMLNFAQGILGTNQIRVAARVGMSREFAKRFLSDFGKNLALTEVQGQTGKKS